jgi:hypothetical protein
MKISVVRLAPIQAGPRDRAKSCQLTNAGTSALAEVLGRNQGPTKLIIVKC